MFWPKDIIQNLLLALPPVRNFAIRRHCTGINSDPALVKEAYETLVSCAAVTGRRILELGPGQTLDVLALAKRNGAAACAAVDVVRYADAVKAAKMGIDYRLYDGGRLPFDGGAFDLVWAWDVLEHLRRPLETLREARRVLAPGGRLVCRVDLRDHYHLADESRWLDCLKYPTALWNAMTWFRSSYVNRLRFSQWEKLFRQAGFARCEFRASTSQMLAEMRARKWYLRGYADADVTTWRFEGACSV